MKKFNNWILNAISGSQTDKNGTTKELKGAKFIILYAYSMLVLLALVISNIFIHIWSLNYQSPLKSSSF